MKNIYKKSILMFSIAATLVGCNEDFLEETPTEFVSADDVAQTGEIYPEILEGTLRGVYAMMYTTGTGGTTRHEDFGQKGYDVNSDLLSGDMALTQNSYSRYVNVAQLLVTTDYTQTQANYTTWRYYYRIIGSANNIIAASGGNDAVITDENKHTIGQAKALRAYAYFYLTQFFIPEYTPDSKILPLYITDTKGVAVEQSRTEDVYNQIISDLNEAITLLGDFGRVSKYEIDQNIAKGLLAYVYGSMGTSDANLKAKDLAEEVIAGTGAPLTSYKQTSYVARDDYENESEVNLVGGFNDVNSSSWIWGVDITLDAGLDLISWWGQMDIFTYSYQSAGDIKGIDQGLFNQINDKDIRKTQFLNDPTDENNLIPYNKFYNAGRERDGQRNIEDDYIYMRVDEFYLLSAEMSAKEGMDVDARNRLKDILKLRFTEEDAAEYAYVDGLTGQDLIDEIYLQTRIEFWGEGKSYLALKRNKGTVVRGDNHLFEVGVPTLYNDDKLTLEIPQSEVQNNPFIN
ncbi:RagB/SusD family nutrient uptake outer membrane protein [Cellulophaga sp. 20_2_10]|uniref:RagB/SusD family nutrient uptake outer membrane protein n=1 Tax=Cellulophaga sp. 20_2_10 TaxID=2942476 RepID=UPI00201ADD1B|nr:RagB/SusD family nutrient uptake outer membrane protein [Cellulophaga sp. 20_2_10]MCL5246890.1 RagB/SusD family nutrient uptake outer membrane protein [Cellulophaga sp. 20_2_10]